MHRPPCSRTTSVILELVLNTFWKRENKPDSWQQNTFQGHHFLTLSENFLLFKWIPMTHFSHEMCHGNSFLLQFSRRELFIIKNDNMVTCPLLFYSIFVIRNPLFPHFKKVVIKNQVTLTLSLTRFYYLTKKSRPSKKNKGIQKSKLND